MMRAVIIAALCVALAGCGFTPLYGGGKVAPQLSSIYVEPIAERNGYELRTRLIELLNSDGVLAGKALSPQDHHDRVQPGHRPAE